MPLLAICKPIGSAFLRGSSSSRSFPGLLNSRLLFSSSLNNDKVKGVRDIPGPRGLPVLGSSLDYLKLKEKAHLLFFDRVKEYGSIYKEKMFSGMPYIITVTDSTDIETVFRSDGKYPDRPDMPLSYEIRDALKIPYALLLSSNEDWYKQRQSMSPFMMVPHKVREQYVGFNHISQDLVNAIKKLRSGDKSLISDVPSLLFKWSFESVSYATLGKRLGSLDIDNVPERCQKMIDSTQIFIEATQEAFFAPPLHKIYPTKLWKKLLSSQKQIYDIAMSFIEERMNEIEAHKQQIEDTDEVPEKMDFLTYMLLSGKLNKEEIASNAVDLMFAGIDTTSYTLCWSLHNLATNIDIQERVREEVKSVVGPDELVTPEHVHQMTLLRNCVKETLRLYPLVPMNIRALKQDVVLSGYHVPAGTQVIIPMLITGRMENYFPNQPDSFIPDRWNRDGEYPKNPYAFLPFGFGPRMCLGRRMAELELHIAIAQILKSFNVGYSTGPDTKMDFILKGILIPEKQMDLVFSDF